jgi:cobalt-zinc-cadmium efflux system membrane fusion protein
VKLSDKETEVIRIPTSAIMQEEDNCYVLVSIGNHKYRRQKVTTGTTDNGKTLILSGLNQGEEIVSTGAFYLLDVR